MTPEPSPHNRLLTTITTYVRSLTPRKWLFLFAIVLIGCTIFAIHQIFTLNRNLSLSPTHTLTKNDSGKTISVKRGDNITLTLSLPTSQISAITFQPQGIVREIASDATTFHLQAIQPGTTKIAVTSRAKCLPGSICSTLIILDFTGTVQVSY